MQPSELHIAFAPLRGHAVCPESPPPNAPTLENDWWRVLADAAQTYCDAVARRDALRMLLEQAENEAAREHHTHLVQLQDRINAEMQLQRQQ